MRIKYKSDETIKETVRALLKEEKSIVVKERLTAVSLFVNGMLKKDISLNIGRGKNYVGTWISAYFKDGIDALQDHRGGDRKSYLTVEQKEELKFIIQNSCPVRNKGWDGKIVVDLIQFHYKVSYTREGVYALLKSLNITYKIATKIDPKKSEEKISTWKEDIKKLIKLPNNTIILAQDESRFTSESNRVTSWSKSGVSVAYSGYRYGTALNCFGSINLQNGELISSFHDKGNAEATIEHLQRVRDNYHTDIPLAFIIDNATWHKTEAVKTFCEENRITLLFLPPYAPEYNPIERVWSYLKSKIRQLFFVSADSFRNFVINLFVNINKTDGNTLRNLCCSLI